MVASDDDDDDDAPPLPPPPDTGSSDNLDRVPPPLPGEEGNEGMAVGGGITMSTSTSSLDNMTAADHDHSAHSVSMLVRCSYSRPIVRGWVVVVVVMRGVGGGGGGARALAPEMNVCVAYW